MIERLSHGDKLMKLEPINGLSLKELAIALERGDGICVELEPGDGTYYNLIILPTWAAELQGKMYRYGISPDVERNYLIVTRMDDICGRTFIASSWLEEWDVSSEANPWTRKFFSWWLKNLWEAINNIRGR